MTAYYNDNEPFVCAWMQNLMDAGLITQGKIDSRPIQEIKPNEIKDYTRCNFFAGIAGWDYALQLAGWPAGRHVWTGSCPCQPFSVAGKRGGTTDRRHLWPQWYRLIAECRPTTIFGEQVASKDGREWFAGVRADLEALGYAVGCSDLCSAGASAPHIRQRLFWVANSEHHARSAEQLQETRQGTDQRQEHEPMLGRNRGLGIPDSNGCFARNTSSQRTRHGHSTISASIGMGNPESGRLGIDGGASGSTGHVDVTVPPVRMDNTSLSGLHRNNGRSPRSQSENRDVGLANADSSGRGEQCGPVAIQSQYTSVERSRFWDSGEFVLCKDGKARRIEPSICPVAYGIPNRVGTIRGAGNAIVPEIAAEFIMAYMETLS